MLRAPAILPPVSDTRGAPPCPYRRLRPPSPAVRSVRARASEADHVVVETEKLRSSLERLRAELDAADGLLSSEGRCVERVRRSQRACSAAAPARQDAAGPEKERWRRHTNRRLRSALPATIPVEFRITYNTRLGQDIWCAQHNSRAVIERARRLSFALPPASRPTAQNCDLPPPVQGGRERPAAGRVVRLGRPPAVLDRRRRMARDA
jgi:hypothetical protein